MSGELRDLATELRRLAVRVDVLAANDAAPAAPVVQPEADLYPHPDTPEADELRRHHLVTPAPVVQPCPECGQQSPYHRGTCSRRAEVFAAPVVQPEPGDRAEQWAKALKPWRTFTAGDGGLSSGSLTAEELAVKGMALADAEVAAAVAAVRADAGPIPS